MKPTLPFASVSLLLLTLAHPAAAGPIIFDNSGAGRISSFNDTPDPPIIPIVGELATLAPLTASVPITQIQVNIFAGGGTQFDFLIFDETTSRFNPVVDVQTTIFQSVSPGWVQSPDFSFTMLAGHQYDVGYAANEETFGSLVSNVTQNGITANGFALAEFSTNLNSFESIFLDTDASPIIRLEGASPAAAAPEPASLTLLSIGLAGWIGGRVLRRRRKSI